MYISPTMPLGHNPLWTKTNHNPKQMFKSLQLKVVGKESNDIPNLML